MDTETRRSCDMLRNRSEENREAMRCFSMPHSVMSPAFSILRQELDSMIRVIYLLSIKDLAERRRLIRSTLRGERWKVQTPKGRFREITDRDMVDLAQKLHGWTQSVYRFGCAFVHLSNFHNHRGQKPFAQLSDEERLDILSHLRYYHGGPARDDPDMRCLSLYIPMVFRKITDNVACYIKQLKRSEVLDE